MVYIVLLNWNDSENTISCIKSIKYNLEKPVKIIVADNYSDDDSLKKIIEYVKENNYKSKVYDRVSIQKKYELKTLLKDNEEFIFIKNEKNGGFAYGNNSGLMYAMLSPNCEYVWLLNTDTEIESNSLKKIIQVFEENQEIGMCGSVLIDFYDRSKIQCFGGGNFYKYLGKSKLYLKDYPLKTVGSIKYKSPSFIMGASLCVRTGCLKSTGLMDETFFMYAEEISWQHAAMHNGWKIGVAPESFVYHKGMVSSGGKSPNYYKMLNKSTIKFIKKTYGIPVVVTAIISLTLISIIQNFTSIKKIKFSIEGIISGLKS